MKGHLQRGFSLLELLVTLFVIVLVTSLVTLNVGDGSQDIVRRSTVDNLAETANYALDEAQFLGWDYALLLTLESDDDIHYRYQWLERGPDGWRAPVGDKDIFAAQDLPSQWELQLTLNDALVDAENFTLAAAEPQPAVEDPADNSPEITRENTFNPQIVLYASGETAPGMLEFINRESGAVEWHIEWDFLGDFLSLPGPHEEGDRQQYFRDRAQAMEARLSE